MVATDNLSKYREITFRLSPARRLRSVNDAVDFVNMSEIVMLWPIKGVDMPSLWAAVAGDQPVAAEHDHPGHVTWRWKDGMLDQRVWYYGKLIRGKATFVSLRLLPSFYALSNRYADLDDYVDAYRSGQLTREAKQIADVLLESGPTNTVRLRRLAHQESKNAKSRFEKALNDLQKGLWIIPCGIAEAGSWRYSFIYELLDRWLPDIPERARMMDIDQARRNILESYLRSVGASEERQIGKIFGWKKVDLHTALLQLEEREKVFHLKDQSWITGDLRSLPND